MNKREKKKTQKKGKVMSCWTSNKETAMKTELNNQAQKKGNQIQLKQWGKPESRSISIEEGDEFLHKLCMTNRNPLNDNLKIGRKICESQYLNWESKGKQGKTQYYNWLSNVNTEFMILISPTSPQPLFAHKISIQISFQLPANSDVLSSLHYPFQCSRVWVLERDAEMCSSKSRWSVEPSLPIICRCYFQSIWVFASQFNGLSQWFMHEK